MVERGASQGGIGKEEEHFGGGSLRETVSGEVSFMSDLVILIKLGQEDQGGEHY